MEKAAPWVKRKWNELKGDKPKEEKDAIKRKVSHAAKSGIKGLKIDGAHLVNMLKGLKFKDDSSSTPKSNQTSVVSSDTIRQVQKPKVVSSNEASYYDTWYYIIESELNNVKKDINKEQ